MVCGVLMVLAFLSNVFGIVRLSLPALREFDHVTAIFQVRQSWEVFARVPTHFRHEYRIVAYGPDGSIVHLLERILRPPLQSDVNLTITFASPRWMKYFTRLDELTEAAWASFGAYLCHQSQIKMISASPISRVEITLITEPVLDSPPAQRPTIRRSFDCAPRSIYELNR